VETVPLIDLATHMQDYRGRVVRTCGPSFSEDLPGREWTLAIPRAFGHHPAGVRILGCNSAAPAPDGGTCVTGRVARRDGSIAPYRDGEVRIVSSAAISGNWFMHSACPARRARRRG
jgi:hypothetical protein